MENNIIKVKDLLDRAEKYRYDKLTVKPKAKSRLTPKEQKENRIALEYIIKHICKYNEKSFNENRRN